MNFVLFYSFRSSLHEVCITLIDVLVSHIPIKFSTVSVAAFQTKVSDGTPRFFYLNRTSTSGWMLFLFITLGKFCFQLWPSSSAFEEAFPCMFMNILRWCCVSPDWLLFHNVQNSNCYWSVTIEFKFRFWIHLTTLFFSFSGFYAVFSTEKFRTKFVESMMIV